MGLLGYLNEVPRPLRLSDIASHPRSVGFPQNHPPMKTFLGAPIRHLGEPVGNIYLTEKEGGWEFTPEDEDILVLFAAQAAMAISNALSHRAEQRARADLEALINISPVGVLVFDAKTGDLVSNNEEARRIVGRLNVPGRSLNQLLEVMNLRTVDGRDIPLDELPTAKALRSGETVRAEEIVIHLPDGRAVSTIVNATPIYSEDGEPISVVATLQDMTPVEELGRRRSEFLGMVSHELREPLATIKGSTVTALGSEYPLGPVETRQFFSIIDERANHLNNLVSQLLDVAQIEAGTFSITPEPTEALDIVDQAVKPFLNGNAKNRIETRWPKRQRRILADRQRIVQVLNNLLSNAAKHSHEGSTIHLNVKQEEFYSEFSVSDEGTGIPDEDLPRMFEKFSQIRYQAENRGVEGIGLGLAISKGQIAPTTPWQC